MTEERRIQLVTEVDTSGARAGFDEIGQQAGQMAGTVTRAGQQAERAVNEIGSGAGAASAKVEAAQRNLVGAIQRTTAQMEAGSRSSSKYYETLAQQRGVDTQVLEPYLAQLRAVELAQARARTSALGGAAGLDDLGISAGQTRAALQQLPAQITDVVTSLQGGMDPMTILVQQGGQVVDAFGGIQQAFQGIGQYLARLITPLTLVAAATAGLAVAFKSGSSEADDYARALAESGNAIGATTDQMAEAARQTAELSGSQKDAGAAVRALAGANQVSAENMQRFAVIATEGQRVLGRSIEDTVSAFDALGSSPLATLSSLNDKYHFLTAEVYAQVKALEDQGRAAEAATAAQLAYADGMEKQRYKVIDTLSDWERGWMRIKRWTSEAMDSIPGVGRAATDFQKINGLLDDRESIEKNIADAIDRKDKYGERVQRAALKRIDDEITAVRASGDAKRAAAKAEADAAQAAEARIKWDNQSDKYLEKGIRLKREEIRIRNEGVAAGVSEKEIIERIAAARKTALQGDWDAAAKKREDAMRAEAAALAEISGLTSTFAADWKMLSDLYGKGAISLEQLTKQQADLLANQPGIKAAAEQEIADRKSMLAAAEDYAKAFDVAANAKTKAHGDLQAQRAENEQIGLGSLALAELNATRLESLALRAEEKVWAAEGMDITGQMAEQYRAEAEALRARAQAVREGAAKQLTFDTNKKALDELNQFLDPARAQTFGEALKGAFGAAGDSMTQLVTSLDAYGIRQAEIDKARKDASVKYATDAKGYADASAAITAKEVKSRLSGYGDMAAAAKGFFSEGSKGYNVLSGAERAYRAAELAMALQAMTKKIFFKQAEVTTNTALNATKLTGEAAASAASTGLAATEASAWGITAVVKAIASLPFPLNLAAGAATLAAVVAIGAKMFGGIGGGGISLSESRQKAQGTGSVLGSDEKSDSIANALSAIESATSKSLNISNGMLTSLRNIEAGIGQFASLLVRTTGVTGEFGSNMATRGSADAFGRSTLGVLATGGIVGLALDKLTGGWVGKITGSVLNSVFGGKQTVEDTGFTMGRANFGSILTGGVAASQYADIKKDGGWFSSDKRRTQLEGIGTEGNRQISTILTSLYDTVFEAGKLLGISGDAFSTQLNSFVVDIGKISLKGKTGEQIQEELSAVFSKVGDDLASFSVAGITQFQKVGEGALETLARVATNYASLDAVLGSLGKTFGATGIASIAAREDLLTMVGGIDELASKTSSFAENFLTEAERLAPVQKYVTEQLALMGKSDLRSRDSFKQYVLGLDLTNAAQRAQYSTLMNLQEAFAQLYPEIEDGTKSIADAKTALADAYNAENDAISSTIDRLTSFASSLKNIRESALLGGLSPLSPQQKYVEAKAQYEAVLAAARGGDADAQSNYQAAFNSFLTASRAVFASSGQYQSDFDYAQASTAEAERWASQQVDVAKAQLDALKLSVSGLIDINKSVLSVRDAIAQLYLAEGKTPPDLASAAPVISMPTPVMYASYGADNTTALVAEIRALRQEVSTLRAEQGVQTAHMIEAQARATSESAEVIAEATTTAVKSSVYVEKRVAPA